MEGLAQGHQVGAGPQTQVTVTPKHLTTRPVTAHDPTTAASPAGGSGAASAVGQPLGRPRLPSRPGAGRKPRVWCHRGPHHTPSPLTLATPSWPVLPVSQLPSQGPRLVGGPSSLPGGTGPRVLCAWTLHRRTPPPFSSGKTGLGAPTCLSHPQAPAEQRPHQASCCRDSGPLQGQLRGLKPWTAGWLPRGGGRASLRG